QGAKAATDARGFLHRSGQAGFLFDLRSHRSRRRMPYCGFGADPGAWHHDGAVRRRHAGGGAVGRNDHRGGRRLMAARMPELDAVTLEVIRNALPAVANEMAADLQRTSYNMMIYEVRDFCTALVGLDGELISQNVGGVSHF